MLQSVQGQIMVIQSSRRRLEKKTFKNKTIFKVCWKQVSVGDGSKNISSFIQEIFAFHVFQGANSVEDKNNCSQEKHAEIMDLNLIFHTSGCWFFLLNSESLKGSIAKLSWKV